MKTMNSVRIAALAVAAWPVWRSRRLAADARQRPSFLKGVWATADGCKMQAAIDAGGPKSVETTPEILTADGYKGWEGGCSFSSVKEDGAGKWTVDDRLHGRCRGMEGHRKVGAR